jgi:hypothetical protein
MEEITETNEGQEPLEKKKKQKDELKTIDVLKNIVGDKGAKNRAVDALEDQFMNILKMYDQAGTISCDSSLLEMYILKSELQILLKVAHKEFKSDSNYVYKVS